MSLSTLFSDENRLGNRELLINLRNIGSRLYFLGLTYVEGGLVMGITFFLIIRFKFLGLLPGLLYWGLALIIRYQTRMAWVLGLSRFLWKKRVLFYSDHTLYFGEYLLYASKKRNDF